ncbi:MAG TPA: N-acyl homoserine lactonase family protein [Acidimicrobiales bacterium]|jgi:glyoxylase-like metal-dependent hydrolase (beta-lactamase superfamily II)|nr:N-acyl homoserine lactonase family protein [Acidimicrobiales bacterium]
MRVRGFCCGWLEGDVADLIEGEEGRVRLPIPAYLIEHAGATLVFDSGLHPDFRDQHSARYQSVAPAFDAFLPEGTHLAERLDACGVSVDDVDFLALSHLHFDHGGGSRLLGASELLVQRAEWLAALADVDGENYLPADVDRDRDPHLLDGEHDVFGDGRATLIPTPGHTAGHQSLLVRTDDGSDLVLCGDACYFERSLRRLALPLHSFNRTTQLEGFHRLGELESAGARLVFGHDATQWPTGPDDDFIVELARSVA